MIGRDDDDGLQVLERLRRLTRRTQWRTTEAIEVAFATHHPQGMAKVAEHFFVSSVEILRPTHPVTKPVTKPFTRPVTESVEGGDRDAGAGIGHLFKMDGEGRLLADLRLGEGALYHPGGIDFDGRHLWVPVAEYRPDSASIVYRVDPESLAVEKVLRFDDHLGAVVRDTDANVLHGLSWGSRRFYAWPLDAAGRLRSAHARPTTNRAHYVDHQDGRYLARHKMLCSGVATYRASPDAAPFHLGGLEIVDLATRRVELALPFEHWSPTGLPLTRNPVWIEASERGLRGYFMPDDDRSTLFVLETEPLAA